jgi:tetratricopeptide (TPR) repeat protein
MQELEVQQLLRQGILAAKAAQQVSATETQSEQPLPDREKLRTQARELLFRVAELDQTNILAWLWLSTVLDDLDDRATCLNNVLALDPDNSQAKAGLTWIERQRAEPAHMVEEPAFTTPQTPPETGTAPPSADDSHASDPANQPEAGLTVEEETAEAFPESTPASVTSCPFCSKPLSTSKTICPHCKTPLVVDCPQCYVLMDVEWETCTECGFSMGDYRLGSVYFYHLATAYQGNQQLKKAWQAILIAERLDPDQPDLYRVKGEIQHEIGQIEESIATLAYAVEKEPEQVGPYLSLGKTLKQEGRWRRAEDVYLEVLRVAPDSSEAHFAYADLMMQRIRPKKMRTQESSRRRSGPTVRR